MKLYLLSFALTPYLSHLGVRGEESHENNYYLKLSCINKHLK